MPLSRMFSFRPTGRQKRIAMKTKRFKASSFEDASSNFLTNANER